MDLTNVTTEPGGSSRPWWGTFAIPQGEVRYWRIGPLELWIGRQPNEWRLRHRTATGAASALAPHLDVEMPADRAHVAPETESLERVGMGNDHDRVELRPALADRPFITRPREPFTILPHQEVELFVTSPLWVQVSVGNPPALVREWPTHRPSDTWFGPTTRTGELCYAARTHCRRTLDEVPVRPHRAISLVRVRNPVDAPLVLERLAVPIPRLSLFAGARGSLWTERLTLTRESAEDDLANLDIGGSPPRVASAGSRVAGPRDPGTTGRIIRAFNAFF